MNTVNPPVFETLALRMEQHVAWVALNRPDKGQCYERSHVGGVATVL